MDAALLLRTQRLNSPSSIINLFNHSQHPSDASRVYRRGTRLGEDGELTIADVEFGEEGCAVVAGAELCGGWGGGNRIG